MTWVAQLVNCVFESNQNCVSNALLAVDPPAHRLRSESGSCVATWQWRRSSPRSNPQTRSGNYLHASHVLHSARHLRTFLCYGKASARVACAKWNHDVRQRCIFRGHPRTQHQEHPVQSLQAQCHVLPGGAFPFAPFNSSYSFSTSFSKRLNFLPKSVSRYSTRDGISGN